MHPSFELADLPDILLAILSLAALAAVVYYARKHRRMVVAGLAFSIFVQAVYYALLAFNVEWLEDNAELRVAVIRPAVGCMFLCLAVFFGNGRLQKLAKDGYAWSRRLSHSFSLRLR